MKGTYNETQRTEMDYWEGEEESGEGEKRNFLRGKKTLIFTTHFLSSVDLDHISGWTNEVVPEHTFKRHPDVNWYRRQSFRSLSLSFFFFFFVCVCVCVYVRADKTLWRIAKGIAVKAATSAVNQTYIRDNWVNRKLNILVDDEQR